MQFTAVYVEGDSGYIVVFVEEFPAIVTQGKTMEQARKRVREAVALLIDAHRETTRDRLADRETLLAETLTIDDAGEFNAVYVEGDDGYIVAFVQEFDVVTQGNDIEDARANVIDVIQVMLRIGDEELRESTAGRDMLLRETLTTDDGDAN